MHNNMSTNSGDALRQQKLEKQVKKDTNAQNFLYTLQKQTCLLDLIIMLYTCKLIPLKAHMYNMIRVCNHNILCLCVK